jgi:hypothetical protein
MPSKGTAYDLEVTRRQPLTEQNLKELCISQFIQEYLANQHSLDSAVAVDKDNHEVRPIGISINEAVFGDFPGTAADRGWIAYMNLGEPLIEERGNIKQPAPDTLSSRVYVNRSSKKPCQFQDTVEFTISNTISWSLEGTLQITFGARSSATIQAMVQTQNTLHKQSTMHNEPNSVGNQMDQGIDQISISQGTASGTGELFAQLMSGITGSVSGSLTTSWSSTSTISGQVDANERVATRAIQRRVARQYQYQIPVTFAGHFAAHYPVPVRIKNTDVQPSNGNDYASVLALDISSEKQFLQSGKLFRNIILKGTADDVSTLAVEHTVFEGEKFSYDEQPLHKTQEARVAV